MKRILCLIAVAFGALLSLPSFAQGHSDDFNYKKAVEILRDNGDESEALDLFSKQLKSTPNHVPSLINRARLLAIQKEYGDAMSDVNLALKVNKPKYSGIYTSTLYRWKGIIYERMDDDRSAATWYKKAYEASMKDNPEGWQDIAFDYAQCLHNAGRIAESDAVYQTMLKADETDTGAMVGFARNRIDEGDYDQAISTLKKAAKITSDYAEIYRFLAKAYDKTGDRTAAVDAGIDYFEKSSDPIWSVLSDVALKHENYAKAAIKTKLKKTEKPVYWHAFLADFYEDTFKYSEALKEYNWIENERGKSGYIHRKKATCYRMIGNHAASIAEASAAVEEEQSAVNLAERGISYRESGQFAPAIKDFTAAIEEDGRYAFLYYSRGWTKRLMGDLEAALEDYDLGIDIDTTYTYIYLERGLTLKMLGREREAMKDFEHVVAMDSVATDGSCAHYALLELGRKKDAEEWMQKIVDENPKDFGNVYDQACLCTRMGNLDRALDLLEQALKLGYRNFPHLEFDMDMDPIRDLARYKELVARYKSILADELAGDGMPAPSGEAQITEVALTRNPGGTFEVPCEINGLPLRMIFDTGASDVSISSVEANFMFKNNYLSERDIKGRRYYQTATGQISPGAIVTLREVRLGDAVLKNVEASVVNSQSAPLLFGQSAMERFGTITIDNVNNKLIIKH